MANERVVEIPWVMSQLPHSGTILDIGCCEAAYLPAIIQPSRIIHALDPRDCSSELPATIIFHKQNLIGNTLPRAFFDTVVVLSTLEHIGLPHYQQKAFEDGDRLALGEIRELLKPTGYALFTVPVGQSKITPWYRQYSPQDLHRLFKMWRTEITYWGYINDRYVTLREDEIADCDYSYAHGAGALAGIIAYIA